MADFKAGDRVVKMSGVCAGKYGTVNSVREDGTLNVTFDGERLPRFCDPERCGAVAANAAKPVAGYRGCKISITDHDPGDIARPGKTYIVEDADGVSVGGFESLDAAKRWCDQHPSRCLNSCNCAARNADTAEGRRFIERAKSLMRGARDKTDLAAVRDRMVRELRGSAAIADDEKDGIEGELFQLHGEEVRRRGA